MSKFKGLSNILKDKIDKNSPEILIGMGLAGMLTTTVMACKISPKVKAILDEERDTREMEDEPDMTLMDKVKLTWKPYLPVVLGYGASAACILGANSINNKRNAALMTAYQIGERAFVEYKDKVIETIGEDKEREIQDAVSRDRIKKDPVNTDSVIFTGKGDALCYDVISGRYFRSDSDKINKAVNDINFTLLNDMYVSLNDFYELLGLDCIQAGWEMGWNVDDGKIEVYLSAQITDNGEPCIVINHENAPKYNYDRLR